MTDLPPPPPPPPSSASAAPPEPVVGTETKPAWKKERTKKQKVVGNSLAAFGAFVILMAIVVVIVGIVSPEPPAKHAKWQASIVWDVSEIVDPATIKVWVTTKNVGQAAAVPDCAVSLNSPNGSFSGYEIFTIDKLAPGHQQTWNGLVTITDQGAQYVTRADSRVTCTDTAG